MKLNELLAFNQIVIQCHDNPDADSIATAFGLYKYLLAHGKTPRILYSGKREITKSNLVLMVKELNIPIQHVESLDKPEILVTVDCQYGEGNVTRFEADIIAIIDHHRDCGKIVDFKEIRSNYASCSTVLYAMLLEERFDINSDKKLSTALYYGLYSDSNSFGEIKHPFDMDLIEDLIIDDNILEQLKNNNFSLQELETAGIALIRSIFDEDGRFAVVKANPCDPNILGLISDLVLQVDCIDCCIVYCEMDGNYKLSVRSCLRDARANDIAMYITDGIGNGGGHKKKAGGYIKGIKYYELHKNISLENYLLNSMIAYFSSYIVIDNKKYKFDLTTTKKYKKKPITLGCVKSVDIEPANTKLIIRTLEGDVNICTGDDIYIMIGINGESYPISRYSLFNNYMVMDEPYYAEVDYPPKAKNCTTGESKEILRFAKCCIPTSKAIIYAKQLDKTTKVFSKWDYEDYMLGNANDYIAFNDEDVQDLYIINEEIFKKTYEPL